MKHELKDCLSPKPQEKVLSPYETLEQVKVYWLLMYVHLMQTSFEISENRLIFY